MERRTFIKAAAAVGLLPVVAACGSEAAKATSETGSTSGVTEKSTNGVYTLTLDHTAWSYDATNHVYYQIGVVYVAKPAAVAYENLAVYVPGDYFTATKNSSGTYTAVVNSSAKVGKFTATTAPTVFPVNTPGYASQAAVTSYSYEDVSSYLEAGFIYVAPGLRGKDSSTSSRSDAAPWGVTDLKSAIRFIRYNSAHLPGSSENMVVFGMSGGGAQSAITGASGDSPLYDLYLKSIGAAMTTSDGTTVSDTVAGVMAWCPITNLDYANAAYEWNMGQFASTDTRAAGTWTKKYSDDLADAWSVYLNKLGLKDSSGNVLSLEKSATGTYLSGSYYDYLVSVIEDSLNDFLAVTKFPYTQTTMGMGGGGAPGGSSSALPSGGTSSGSKSSGGKPSGTMPSGGSAPSGSSKHSGGAPSGGSAPSGASSGSVASGGPGGSSSSTTYKTLDDYLKYLNKETKWVEYNHSTKKAKVLNLAGFVKSQKPATKDVGAFDGITRQETENTVMGLGLNKPIHFAKISEEVMAANQSDYAKYSTWKSSYSASTYLTDFNKTDAIGRNVLYRDNIYNPMYYLNSFYPGYQKGTVAPHWRIRTGIMQGDTANTTEIDLALALEHYDGVKGVDFATIWGQGHTMAELTGNATTNFIDWVEKSFA